jgi:hypothetical protein
MVFCSLGVKDSAVAPGADMRGTTSTEHVVGAVSRGAVEEIHPEPLPE